MIINVLKNIIGIIKCKLFRINRYGKKIYIGKSTRIKGGKNIFLGDNVSIRPNCFINCNKNAKLIIDEGTDIGTRCRISSANTVKIGKKVLFGPNVYLADQDHNFKDINIPIMDQGVNVFQEVNIGDGTWIGTNVVIVGNVQIGKNCVIGANSVVNRNIEDYSVAVGAPAKVIKKYNLKEQRWQKL